MTSIPQEFQEELIDFLCSIKALQNSQNNRTALLDGFSPAGYIERSSAFAADLKTIVGFISSLGKSDEETHKGQYCLQIVMERAREYVKGVEGEQRLNELLDKFRELITPGNDLAEVLFVNRVDEINRIASPPTYYLVDAPAGYGKTQLLQELQRRFRKAGWYCAYVSIHKGMMMLSVTEALAAELETSISPNTTKSYGERLGIAINAKKGLSMRGIMLLLDLEKEPELSVFKELTQNFIPDIQRTLIEHSDTSLIFRAVIAGRHLATTKEYLDAKIPLIVVTPTLFDYSVVRDFLRDYVKKQGGDESDINRIAAHLTHLTGGHPECISLISKIYLERDWKQDSLTKSEVISELERIIRDRIQCIYNDLTFFRELRDFVVKLSVFRYLDHALLSNLVSNSDFAEGSISALSDRLTRTYLFSRQGRWIKNEVVRRLLVLWLQYNSEDFEHLCEEAKRLCAEGLRRPKEREPEVWVTEYLFQCLQASARNIQDTTQRNAIRHIFWEEELPKIMRDYFAPDALADEIRYAKDCLIERIRADWEFQFTINYYLQEDHYTEQPYQRLLESIEDFNPIRA